MLKQGIFYITHPTLSGNSVCIRLKLLKFSLVYCGCCVDGIICKAVKYSILFRDRCSSRVLEKKEYMVHTGLDCWDIMLRAPRQRYIVVETWALSAVTVSWGPNWHRIQGFLIYLHVRHTTRVNWYCKHTKPDMCRASKKLWPHVRLTP